jgi:hypothetical protein|tara:strand:- start:809 stop:1183 length:375 start_codon:yes stop_codon:yes gene_type:complete
MNSKRDDDLLQQLKEIFESVVPSTPIGEYPKDALPLGTYVRPIRHDRLGVITDAFYGDLDTQGKKIIIYTILLFPPLTSLSPPLKNNDQYYITNEYEYEVIAYLMIPPANLSELTKSLGGGLFL